jgi:hypothetical protein
VRKIALLLLCACSSLHAAARDAFVHKYSCPEERVTVRKRPDLKHPAADAPKPPAEVAKDPERLKLWKADHPSDDAQYKYFQVSGCDHDDVYTCTWQVTVEADGEATNYAECAVINPE